MIQEFEFKDHEEWLDISGFEGIYQVSNKGYVRSLNFHREKRTKVLKKYIDRYGYEKVVLTKNGKPHYFTVHRLVAQAFLDNPDGKKEVDHIDCNPLNNDASNLRWATNVENLFHSHELGRQRINATPIVAIREDGEVFKYRSQRFASICTGVGQWAISRALRNETQNLKGWKFEYDNGN